MRLRLYSTEACCLCEQALDILNNHGVTASQVDVVDIVDNPDWLQRFGTAIPVLEHLDSGRLLRWPFDEGQLQTWLGGA